MRSSAEIRVDSEAAGLLERSTISSTLLAREARGSHRSVRVVRYLLLTTPERPAAPHS
jgi:hypothetical protein